MARILPSQRQARERRAVERASALLDLITTRLSCGAVMFKAELDVDDGPEFMLISELPPLLSGGKRERTSERAFRLQLAVFRLYVEGLSVRATARMLNKPHTTIQRALKLIDGFIGLPLRVRPAIAEQTLRCETCRSGEFCYKHDLTQGRAEGVDVDWLVEQTEYPYDCPVCEGPIFYLDQALKEHSQCADKLRSEAA